MGRRHCRIVISEGRKNLPTSLRESRWIRASVILSLARDADSPKANQNTTTRQAEHERPSRCGRPAKKAALAPCEPNPRKSGDESGEEDSGTRATSRRRPDPCRSFRRAGGASPDEGNIDRGHAIERCSVGGMICP